LEWKFDHGLEWQDLSDDLNGKMQVFTQTLNQLYKEEGALWALDDQETSLEVIDADNLDETTLTFMRQGKTKKDFLIVVLNLTPVERHDFAIGVPYAGTYHELLNTEHERFGGTWIANNADQVSEAIPFKQYDHQIKTILPALGALIIKPEKIKITRKKATPNKQTIKGGEGE